MKLCLKRSFNRLPRLRRPRGAKNTSKATMSASGNMAKDYSVKPEVKKIPNRPEEKKKESEKEAEVPWSWQ